MLDSLLPSLPGIALTIAILLGGLWAFRRSSVKQLGELQQSVIDTYKSQSDAQEKQIKILERKVMRLEAVLTTLQVTLKRRRGLLIEINDDVITLTDQRTGVEQTMRIRFDTDMDEDHNTPEKDES